MNASKKKKYFSTFRAKFNSSRRAGDDKGRHLNVAQKIVYYWKNNLKFLQCPKIFIITIWWLFSCSLITIGRLRIGWRSNVRVIEKNFLRMCSGKAFWIRIWWLGWTDLWNANRNWHLSNKSSYKSLLLLTPLNNDGKKSKQN